MPSSVARTFSMLARQSVSGSPEVAESRRT